MQVERTRLRPIASGLLTPFQGLSFLGFQLLLGLGILLQLNNFRFVLLNLSIYTFLITYVQRILQNEWRQVMLQTTSYIKLWMEFVAYIRPLIFFFLFWFVDLVNNENCIYMKHLCFLGLILLIFNSRILGASSLLLVFSYPLMKRFTFWVMIIYIYKSTFCHFVTLILSLRNCFVWTNLCLCN